jgi:hypothetical protein
LLLSGAVSTRPRDSAIDHYPNAKRVAKQMSVWDPEARMRPFGWLSPYGHNFDPNPDLSVLESKPRWWGREAEANLRESAQHWQWAWQYAFSGWFAKNVRATHQTEAMSYAAAKAKQLGLLDSIRLPVIGKPCLVCREPFREDGVAGSCLDRYGDIDSIDFCNPCMLGVVSFGSRWGLSLTVPARPESASNQEILDWLRWLARDLERIPSQAFPTIEEFRAADREERLRIVKLCQDRPSVERVKELFGTWLQALVAAGILEDGTRRLMRGTQCLARDGHLCFSLGEKTVDDLLTEMGLSHEKEPHYPESTLRADFLVGETYVEFLGLKGDLDYDEKTAAKTRLCKAADLRLLFIEPKDLMSRKSLVKKIDRAVRR